MGDLNQCDAITIRINTNHHRSQIKKCSFGGQIYCIFVFLLNIVFTLKIIQFSDWGQISFLLNNVQITRISTSMGIVKLVLCLIKSIKKFQQDFSKDFVGCNLPGVRLTCVKCFIKTNFVPSLSGNWGLLNTNVCH